MTTSKPVALVVGASRGLGRQIAIDLAKTGYTGTSNLSLTIIHLTSRSRRRRKNHLQRRGHRPLPAGPQLLQVDHQHRRPRDHRRRRHSLLRPGRRARCRAGREHGV